MDEFRICNFRSGEIGTPQLIYHDSHKLISCMKMKILFHKPKIEIGLIKFMQVIWWSGVNYATWGSETIEVAKDTWSKFTSNPVLHVVNTYCNYTFFQCLNCWSYKPYRTEQLKYFSAFIRYSWRITHSFTVPFHYYHFYQLFKHYRTAMDC